MQRHSGFKLVLVCGPNIFLLTPANLTKGEGTLTGVARSVKHSRWNEQHAQFNNTRDGEVDYNGIGDHRTVANEAIPKRGKIVFANVLSAEKVRVFLVLVCISVACHMKIERRKENLYEHKEREGKYMKWGHPILFPSE